MNAGATSWRAIAVATLITAGLAVPTAPAHAECFISDGTSPSGQPAAGFPQWFTYDTFHYIGAHYNSCDASVRVKFGTLSGGAGADHWNVAYGQRPASDGPIAIFSHQLEFDADSSEALFDTAPTDKRVYAFFRAQGCDFDVIGGSDCMPWSPNLVIDLGNNYLTRF